MTLKLDARLLYEIMSEFHTLGDEEYGGQGTFQEAILVGYIYGLLTENGTSAVRIESKTHKVFSFGGYEYIVWFDEIYAYAEDEDENEKEESREEDGFEVSIEDAKKTGRQEEFEEDEPVLLPVAIEGPYSDEDIRDFLSNGDL